MSKAAPPRILVVEDERDIAALVAYHLTKEGYRVRTAEGGLEALEAAGNERPDIVLLDLMLPGYSGYEVLAEMRRRPELAEIPVVVLTARRDEADRVRGLELGADDYVTKPFSVKELLARAEALLRRTHRGEQTSFEFGDCRLDLTSRTLTRAGREVALSPKEFELLAYFVKNPGRALHRDTIMASVWGFDAAVTPRSIDRFVTVLRQKIEPAPTAPRFIKTVREFGYKFELA